MLTWVLGLGIPLLFIAGIGSAVHALMHSQRAQTTIAWILGLVLLPIVTVPLYWLAGRTHYQPYQDGLENFERSIVPIRQQIAVLGVDSTPSTDYGTAAEVEGFETLAGTPFRRGNLATLLVDGDATYAAIFDAIDRATNYLLIQFYTIRDDRIGADFKERLIAAAGRGVAVYLLYDEIGSIELSATYLDDLTEAGVRVSAFAGGNTFFGRFRLNFRNHRKIVVADGRVALLGGLNVGDEYLGRSDAVGAWRDTHLLLEGPAVVDVQMLFATDWHFATEECLDDLNWLPDRQAHDASTLIAGSGPHEAVRSCALLFAHLIGSAERRVWIATPYLVPNEHLLRALQLAALRGVDVRVLVPRTSDSFLFRLVPYAFMEDILLAGGKIYLYEEGFLHQKVALVDDAYGLVSTANFDNRSFFLNFEVSCVVCDESFCGEMESMLQSDLGRSSQMTMETLKSRHALEQLGSKMAQLLAPIL